MTRTEFYRYLRKNGCETFPLGDFTTANQVGIRNTSNNRTAYIDTPMDNRPMKAATLCRTCLSLLIPIPDEAKKMKEVMDFLDNNRDFNISL